jgi:hypothetical protein
MSAIIRNIVNFLLVLLCAGALACGGESSQENAEGQKAGSPDAEVAAPSDALPVTSAPFAGELEAAGFETAYYMRFPATVAGKDGRLILYRSASGGKDGGMIFVQDATTRYEWVWHWYFPKISPERAEKTELNQDGLWDIRMYAPGGKRYEFLQDDTFTLAGGGRRDRIALNGESSPVIPGNPLWFCFDNNHNTAWMAPTGGGEPYIEFESPFGLKEGILTVKFLPDHQPRLCEIEADGKKIQELELEATTKEQLIQLDAAARQAKRIRIVVKSCHGSGTRAAIAELSIR